MITIVSIILYLVTFIAGFSIDKTSKKSKVRKCYVVWLYIFLCFGYMTGSDWRSYEIEFNDLKAGIEDNSLTEPGFSLLFSALANLIGDFRFSLCMLKCVYLYSLLRLLKECTNYPYTSISILMPISLVFLLINDPLRFMTALILVNFAIIYIFKGKIKISYLLLILSIFFHFTCIVFLSIPLIIKYSVKLARINSIILILLYVVISYIASNPTLVASIQNTTLSVVMQFMETKDYLTYYNAEEDESFFSVGSMIQMFLSVFIIISKKTINHNNKEEMRIFGVTITSLFFTRILSVIPTGFRLVIPFDYFYAMYIANLFQRKKLIGYIVSLYLMLMMSKDIYYSYSYIPYTNSIYYIITQDYDSYDYRREYNEKAYKNRIGRDYQH